MFNNRYLVTVVNTIASFGHREFTVRMVSDRSHVPDNLIRPVVHRLREAGLIELHRVGATNSRGPKFMKATNSQGWTELKTLCRKLAQGASAVRTTVDNS